MFTIEGFHCSSFDEMCTAVADNGLDTAWNCVYVGPIDFVDRDKQCLVPKTDYIAISSAEVCPNSAFCQSSTVWLYHLCSTDVITSP